MSILSEELMRAAIADGIKAWQTDMNNFWDVDNQPCPEDTEHYVRRAVAEAAYRETLKMINELENPFEGYIDVIENIRMAKSLGFERFRQALNKLEVSNGH